jgi:hypothetical protein
MGRSLGVGRCARPAVRLQLRPRSPGPKARKPTLTEADGRYTFTTGGGDVGDGGDEAGRCHGLTQRGEVMGSVGSCAQKAAVTRWTRRHWSLDGSLSLSTACGTRTLVRAT